MNTETLSQLTALRAQLVQALAAADTVLNTLRATPTVAEHSFRAAVLTAARRECHATAYYMYMRMQRTLAEQGFGHVKRDVITGLLTHEGWRKERKQLGFYWFPPTDSVG